ncbi:AzlC family ABC transporter permease [Mesorhizobium xinjiangense]|uniref:AzlC family ABC transporter permease n=1 Tax=Mesorhizobium xinjiangense TaxID=2678685 RepID=UPI0012ECD719|nr:AzlC family ABC transporter permease [Mesorhizobium xinjiangense]
MSVQSYTETSAASDYWRGFRLGVPVMVASAPFGVLFGALAVQNGLSVWEVVFMSATIYAGASQMVGIDLFGQTIAPWVIVLSIVAVNFRHVLYSAAVGRRIGHWTSWQRLVGFFFLVDPQYAEAERQGEQGGTIGFSWYMGMATPIYVMWVVDSWVGASFSRLLPDTHALGIDFLLPIYFLGLVMGFRKRPLWLPIVLASSAASILAYLYVGSPWHVSIGAAAGVALAAMMPPTQEAIADYQDPPAEDAGEEV